MAALTGGDEAAEHILRVASASSAQSNDGLFLLGGAIWFALVITSGWSLARLQMDYLRLYRQARHVNFPVTPEEMSEIYLEDPQRWLTEGPSMSWRMWRLVWERQSNPTLETARRRVVRWFWITFAAVMFGGAIPVVLSMVGN